ncbi:MAG: hypothetical protein M1817_000598 [Caeruleum heppii]|nr:MAG: hypothetical protein M1817_000598 [Caeruleum heppii]
MSQLRLPVTVEPVIDDAANATSINPASHEDHSSSDSDEPDLFADPLDQLISRHSTASPRESSIGLLGFDRPLDPRTTPSVWGDLLTQARVAGYSVTFLHRHLNSLQRSGAIEHPVEIGLATQRQRRTAIDVGHSAAFSRAIVTHPQPVTPYSMADPPSSQQSRSETARRGENETVATPPSSQAHELSTAQLLAAQASAADARAAATPPRPGAGTGDLSTPQNTTHWRVADWHAFSRQQTDHTNLEQQLVRSIDELQQMLRVIRNPSRLSDTPAEITAAHGGQGNLTDSPGQIMSDGRIREDGFPSRPAHHRRRHAPPRRGSDEEVPTDPASAIRARTGSSNQRGGNARLRPRPDDGESAEGTQPLSIARTRASESMNTLREELDEAWFRLNEGGAVGDERRQDQLNVQRHLNRMQWYDGDSTVPPTASTGEQQSPNDRMSARIPDPITGRLLPDDPIERPRVRYDWHVPHHLAVFPATVRLPQPTPSSTTTANNPRNTADDEASRTTRLTSVERRALHPRTDEWRRVVGAVEDSAPRFPPGMDDASSATTPASALSNEQLRTRMVNSMEASRELLLQAAERRRLLRAFPHDEAPREEGHAEEG